MIRVRETHIPGKHIYPCDTAKKIHSILVEGVGQQQEQSVKEGFLRECQHCSVLSHPNIVRFMGIYYQKKSSTIPVMIMELMDESLYDYINKLPMAKNAWMKKGSILPDVAEGLSYLHAQKPAVVHRDLSPKNILLKAGKGEVPVAKISDLGVAKIIKADSRRTQSVLTKAPGTQDFMPPLQSVLKMGQCTVFHWMYSPMVVLCCLLLLTNGLHQLHK